jgi:major vault protein
MSDNTRDRDLVLAPNEFAFILDETKGHVVAYVGPHKTSLANTDRPVTFDDSARRFRRCILEEAIRPFPYAEEGWYVVLENPAREGDEEHPKSGPNGTPKLTWGRKVNLPGPITFPLWPSQVAGVIQGHHLRSNQYLVVKVYNEEAALENWRRAVVKPKKDSGLESEILDTPGSTLTLGQLLVIRGNEVSFYIPPTGIEVVKDSSGSYVREAVTLERLEYCILLDEDGNKRYIEGPDVVFPHPTERFVERGGHRKFKAMELNEISGLYIKVIAPYTETDGTVRRVGEELFLTGKDQMIYFPRPEHALIRYGDQQGEIHYAVAIPAGQARYVLNRLSGEIYLKHGPCMFLPDPRKEVLARRVLSPQECQLMFPGNHEVAQHNSRFWGPKAPPAAAAMAKRLRDESVGALAPAMLEEKAGQGVVGDDFTRSQQFTPPRTITLDQRFEGAVNLNIWTGYAVQVVSRSGNRRVVVGPAALTLEYDETLEGMELSCGTPKSDESRIKTVYLRILNNQVSDQITAETKDLCQVYVQVSYRVNFEGDPSRWFNVENYVKFLTDHLRSVVRNAIKQRGIEEFHSQAIAVVRNAVLGSPGESGRSGRVFEENGLKVYDVDVLDVTIGDDSIASIFTETQHSVVHDAVTLAQEEKRLEATQRGEQIKQAIARATFETRTTEMNLKIEEVQLAARLEQMRIEMEGAAKLERIVQQQRLQEATDQVHQAELGRVRTSKEQELGFAQRELEQRIAELRAEVQATVDKAGAISPDLVAALQAFSDRDLAAKMAQSMGPLAILGGKSVSEVLSQLLKGSSLEHVLVAPAPKTT